MTSTSPRSRFALVCTLSLVAALPVRTPGQVSPAPAAAPRADLGAIQGEGKSLDASTDEDTLAAGLPRGTTVEILTWPRAYMLALVLFRDKQGRAARGLDPTLDGMARDKLAAQAHTATFDRFRREFLTAAPMFHDPAAEFLDLLRREQRVVNARRIVNSHESVMQVLYRRGQEKESGVTQLDIDGGAEAGQRVRESLDQEVLGYRDRLEEVRVAFGIAPDAPVVPDRRTLVRFRLLFDKLEQWQFNPNHKLLVLSSLARGFPAIGEVELKGRPVLAAIERDPDRLASELTTVSRLARENRSEKPGTADAARLLRLRSQLRHLVHTRRVYQMELARLVYEIRLMNRAMGLLRVPGAQGAPPAASAYVRDLLAAEAAILECQNHLVDHWTSFRADRLGFYRDLGVLPFGDWEAFYRQFGCTRDEFIAQPPPAGPDIPVQPAGEAPAP